MRPLSTVQHWSRYGVQVRWFTIVLLNLALVPGWSGLNRLAHLPGDAAIRAVPVAIPKGARRIGALTLVGAVALESDTRGFGGFSAIAVARGRVTLLTDGGDTISFHLARGRVADTRVAALPAGPGTGWIKEDRDTESLALDAANGNAWVGFERANAIWRYAPGFTRAEAHATPRLMRGWRTNGGAETLARLPDGRFLAIAETSRLTQANRAREALLFAGDPADPHTPTRRLGYLPPPDAVPTDAAALPSGDLVVLNRRWRLPYRFTTLVTLIPAAQVRPGVIMRDRTIALLAPPLLGENAEGIAVTQEHGATMLWIVTDNDGDAWRRTYLMKFRLAGPRN